jgi:hypothetical protein
VFDGACVLCVVRHQHNQAFISSDSDGARAEQAPRLWLDGNGTNVHWQIELIDVSTRSSQTRFALELHYVLDKHAVDNTTLFVFANHTSIDDEYTPGVFWVSLSFCAWRTHVYADRRVDICRQWWVCSMEAGRVQRPQSR